MEVTAYAITRTLDAPLAEAVERVTAALAAEGFGDPDDDRRAGDAEGELDLDVGPYVILGACNPQLAGQGIALEPDLGVLLPCNVVVRRAGERTVVAAMEPLAAMGLAANPAIEPLAADARERIERAVASI